MIETQGIDHVALTVRDLAASVQWYQRILGLNRQHEEVWDVPVMLGAGTTAVALFPSGEPPGDEQPGTQGTGFRHLAFRVTQVNFALARSFLDDEQVAYEFQDHEIAHSIYFSDLDGNQLEITTYEID